MNKLQDKNLLALMYLATKYLLEIYYLLNLNLFNYLNQVNFFIYLNLLLLTARLLRCFLPETSQVTLTNDFRFCYICIYITKSHTKLITQYLTQLFHNTKLIGSRSVWLAWGYEKTPQKQGDTIDWLMPSVAMMPFVYTTQQNAVQHDYVISVMDQPEKYIFWELIA